jgi:hypothetical protein
MKKINIDLTQTQSTIINWPNQVRQIVDGYRSYHCIAHGVQKDAIQNSWDARKDKNYAKGWEIEFELIESKDLNLFTFTDKGTTGLTGRILLPEDLEKDLPVVEKWGRFENVAFTKDPSEHALGARGRGKFIFVGASDYSAITTDGKNINKLILYDTLREDGVYRFGFRTIISTDSRIQAIEGEEAKGKLKELTNDLLKPLKYVGTRVVIVEPIKELINDVKNGNFIKYIEETWWEIIRDYNATIKVKVGTMIQNAKLDKHFQFPGKDSKRFKTWIKKDVKLPQAPNYKVKNLVIVYDAENNIQEDLRGIFIQRGRMKVCAIQPTGTDRAIINSIYGYINFDQNLEQELQKDEGIEHYSFDFKQFLPRTVKNFIIDECDKFLREKLGINMGTKTKPLEKEKSAQEKALYQVNLIAKQFGLTGRGIINNGNSGGSPPDPRQLRLKFGKFLFPSETLRVNYGETISNIGLSIENDTAIEQNLGVRFSIVFNEEDEVVVYLDNKEVVIKNKSLVLLKNISETISNAKFTNKGKYTFLAKLVSLNTHNRGLILHQLKKNFWVEENPPQKGLFDEIEGIPYPENIKSQQGEAQRSDGLSYKFIYNINHPAKKAVDNDEDKLTKYLIELMCIELAWIDLRNTEHKIFSTIDLENPSDCIRKLNKFLGEIKYKIYI